jgi:3-oxoacyl-[acyl-carrier protein] reductase
MTTVRNGSGAGRVAIVTGGSRGAGLATACRLAATGFAVVVDYLHDQRAAEAVVESILAGRGDAVAVRADVADDLDVTRLFAESISAFGGVDVVVHAAGSRMTAAAIVVSREAARRVRDHGAIVNLSAGAPPRPLAVELRARDITVNAVQPEVGRPCAPDRVADVVEFLLSDDGHRLTGRVVVVGADGFTAVPSE